MSMSGATGTLPRATARSSSPSSPPSSPPPSSSSSPVRSREEARAARAEAVARAQELVRDAIAEVAGRPVEQALAGQAPERGETDYAKEIEKFGEAYAEAMANTQQSVAVQRLRELEQRARNRSQNPELPEGFRRFSLSAAVLAQGGIMAMTRGHVRGRHSDNAPSR